MHALLMHDPSHAAVTGNPEARRTMHALLMHDPRYQALNDLPVQREQIIMTYLEELQRKGPPPLPTIS
ncbi:hypothetical protein JYU34_018040 [Plutella xylostella]|uniref:Uncharacterized protein n=1 Tax=Plutella xylostella TaxID=51655 RepID=A0ABQ7PZT0_PLUXY|nr:hypothetical protein JYU34_018040 [Plutella xylostella]